MTLRQKLAGLVRHRLFSNMVALYGAHIARYLFPLITVPYLARVLGVGTWGTLAFIQSYCIFISQIVEYGFGLSGTRDVARHRDSPYDISYILSGVLGAQVLLGLLAVGITFFVYPWVPVLRNNPYALWLGVLAAVAQGFNLLWYFRGLEKMRLVASLDVFTKAIATAGIFLLVRSPEDMWKVLAASVFANLVSVAIASNYALHDMKLMLPSTPRVLKVLREGWPLFLVRAGASIFSAGNIIVLGLFTTTTQVGYFAGAMKIITAIRGLLTPAVDASFPKISRMVTHSLDEARHFIRKVFKGMVSFGLLLTLTVFIGAPLLVKILLGPGFEPVVAVLRIFALFPLIASVNHVLGSQWMLPIGLDKAFSTTTIVAGVLNLTVVVPICLIFPEFAHLSLAGVFVTFQAALGMIYALILWREKKLPV